MNESTLTRLKIIVERAVRPVRASTDRKRKMREELLAHVVGVFEEEGARLGDERAALEQTALRFGNPAEVTSQLQESVPARDAIRRSLEGRPGEAALWTLVRLACVASAGSLVGLAAVLFALGWATALLREAMISGAHGFFAMPAYLFGLAFLTDWIEKGVYDPAGVSRLRVALSAASSLLLMLLFVAGACWPAWSTGWDHLGLLPWAGLFAATSVFMAWNLAQLFAERRRYHEEWGRLPIEMPS
jgi:hypothetical protein